jgi:hypothetical protein
MDEIKPVKKSITLYDAGGWFLIYMFFGVAFIGVVLDYLWNLLVLSCALRCLHSAVPFKKRAVSVVIITIFGLLVDWLYYEITWGILVLGNVTIGAVFTSDVHHAYELLTILIPMLLIGIVNYLVVHLFLHVDTKNSVITGIIAAVFTAPWLIAGFVLLGG